MSRARLAVVVVAVFVAGCEGFLGVDSLEIESDSGSATGSDATTGDSGPSIDSGAGDAANDASTQDAAADAGSSETATSDAAPDAMSEAATEAGDAAFGCLSSLSGIGTGNFSIAFTFTSTSAAVGFAEAGAASLSLAAQRPTGCVAGDYWDVNLNSGKVVGQIFAIHNVVLQPNLLADDSQPHRVVFTRINGVAQLSVDATSATAADTDSYGTFPAVTIGSENGCATPLAGYGTVSDFCISVP